MCSIIVINHHYNGFPLVIASNRDENPSRKSSEVQVLTREPHPIIGGRDEEHGGTWLAVNRFSLFAGITNQGNRNKKLETRGNIVLNILKSQSLEEMIARVNDIDPSKYNGFNLVFGNQNRVFVANSYVLNSMVVNEIKRGVSLITNDMNFSGSEKSELVHYALDKSVNDDWNKYYSRLKRTLHEGEFGLKLKKFAKAKLEL
jgi:uncharacterized protein with NRDE domain